MADGAGIGNKVGTLVGMGEGFEDGAGIGNRVGSVVGS